MRARLRLLSLALLVACDAPAVPPDAAARADATPGVEDASPSDAAGATEPGSSGGAGGLTCARTANVARDPSITYCVATVAGVELKIVEPDAAEGALHLALYLHGDGARAYDGDTAPRIQAAWSRSRAVLYVAARAPNGCAWWLRPDLASCDAATEADRDTAGANADALAEVLTALRGGWDLTDDPVLLGGSSGGAVFLTGSFLPRYGDANPGAYALGCGGAAPWEPAAGPAAVGSSVLFYAYGDQDFLLPDIEASVGAYEALGYPTVEDVRPGAEHCAFDHIGWVTEAWQAYLDR